MIKGIVRRWIVTGLGVATFVTVTAAPLAGAAGDAKVSAYVMKDPIGGAVALPTSTLQPYLAKVLAGLTALEPTYGVAHVATQGWISQSNGIEDIVEIGAFTQTIVNPTVQAQSEVLVSCKTATGVTPKKTTALKGIPGSTEAQCVTKKGVRLSTSIGWSYANVIVLDLVSGTTKSVAQKWALEQFKHVPPAGIVVEAPTQLSSQYAAATEPMYNAMNKWLIKFLAWANLNGTLSQAAPFDHPFVVALNACAAKLSAERWSSAAQPNIDAAVQAIKVLSTHVNNLAFATSATAPSWGTKYGLDQVALLTALTTAQRSTR
ncbi:MAG TPA: hypothetical protein VII60_02370 [Acidimicrobiales bacterium]